MPEAAPPLPEPSGPETLALDGGAVVDLRRGVVVREGQEVGLTTKEVALLAWLGARPGQVVSFEELHDEVWHMAPSVVSRAAYFAWRRLLPKVEPDPEHPMNLVSHHGDGVSYRPPPPLLPAPRAWIGPAPVGREALVAELRARLSAGARLLTLTGPAGSGKTTVARRVAQEEGGGWVFVGLDAARSDAEVLTAVATALGVGRVEEALARGPCGLLLDGGEAVVGVLAARVGAWLAAFPGLRVMCTNRSRLRLPEEQLLTVGPLSRDAAVRLFVERARAEDDHFDAERHLDDVGAVVDALDRLPLAIVLTAARARLVPPRLLRGAGVGEPALERAVAASWELLEAWEREALVDLACLPAGATLAAAGQVLRLPRGRGALDVLQRLLDHSLVRVDLDGPEPRYAAWAPVAASARARLAEDPAAEAATVGRLARWAATLGPPALGGHPSLRPELPNLLVAAEVEGPAGVAAGLRAVSVLAECGPVEEAERLARRLLALAGPPMRGWAQLQLARVAQFGGRLDEARRLAEAVYGDEALLDAAGPSTGQPSAEGAPALLRAAALTRLATIALNQGRPDEAPPLLRGALPALAAGDPSQHGAALLMLGVARARGGHPEEGVAHLREALTAARAAGDRVAADSVRRELARVQMRLGQARAAELSLRSLRATQPSSILELHLASALFLQGRAAEAAPLLDRVMEDTARRGLPAHETSAALLRGLCALELDDDEALARVCDRGEVLTAEASPPYDPFPTLRAAWLARRGQAADAAALLQRAPPRTDGDRPTAAVLQLLVAEVQLRCGAAPEARAALARARALAAEEGIPLEGVHPSWARLSERLQHLER